MPGSWPQQEFPALTDQNCAVVSPITRRYNCLAWAAANNARWWWPDAMGIGYWPPNVPREETVDAFLRAYGTLGYSQCADGSLELDIEKIVIYLDTSGTPTHAALQLQDGRWTSKMGGYEDIEHATPEALSGPRYGKPSIYMSRARQQRVH